MRIQGRRAVIPRKLIVTAAVVLVGAAIGTALALLWPGSALASQSIVFTSAPPTGPAPGGTYVVTAKGGASGNQVFITIDSPATSVCSISGSTVTFNQPGTCTIDANQAGNAHYQPAAQAQQTVTVNSGTKISQSISFTSTPPTSPAPGGTYVVTAKGGASGNQVFITIGSPATSVCSISGSTVTFNQPGTCTIDANQAGNAHYQPAPQAQQTVTVNSGTKISQSISFTSTPPTSPAPGGTYVVTAKGGASGNQVFITIDSPATSVCSISGSTVTFNQPGTCTIDANQAGNAHYQPAPQAQQTVTVNSGTKISQSISFTSTPPAGGEFIGDTYMVSASGGASGNQVVIIIDSSSTSVCSISGSTVTFNQSGTCTIDANQAGNATYQPAPQAQQTVTVNQPVK